MKILIVEDEKAARERLTVMLQEISSDLEVIAATTSIRDTVDFFQQGGEPNLAFFDIQLTDGLSFEIFRQFPVPVPVIFTTAYDQYLLEAFHTNAIDYLLKPIKRQELARALQKYRRLQTHFSPNLAPLMEHLQGKKTYLQRIAASKGGAYVPVPVTDIAWFSTRHKITFLRTFSEEKLIVDKPLAALEDQLDPAVFRRVNRQYIVNIHAIRKVQPHHKGKLKLDLHPAPKEEVIVSQEQAASVKNWLEA
jgi:DNA-binding LytR/AlgR family response regulator